MSQHRLIGLGALVIVAACGPAAPPQRSAARAAPSAPSVPRSSPTPSSAPALPPSPLPSPSPTVDPAVVAIAQASRGLYSRSAAQVLARLRSAGPALRAPASSPATRAQAARLEQLAYAQLVAHPEWQPQVLPQLPADLREAADANVSAGTELAAMGGDPSERLPHWAVSAPAPAPQLMAYYHEAEAAFGVGWHYLAAINLVETAMGRIRGLSYAGAAGPMQFMPETWASFGLGDINNPRDSILAAGRYLKARGAPADMDKAIYSYNLDHHYVRAVKTYAARILTDPSAYTGYYNWQVYISTVAGPALLPEGWTN